MKRIDRKRKATACALLLASAVSGTALAQSLTFGGIDPASLAAQEAAMAVGKTAAKGVSGAPTEKIATLLAYVYYEHQQHAQKKSTVPFASSLSYAPVQGDLVAIDAIASGKDPATLKADLEALGLQGGAAAGRLVSGWMPIDKLDEASQLGSLQSAQLAASISNTGSVNSQGDQAQRSDQARTLCVTGLSGNGLDVGTLSDSYNSLGTAPADVTSGDLPAGVVVIQDSGTTDEGRAMMQIIHDVAPGASLQFATANGGQANFANNINALWLNGCYVINDDVSYFAEPFFQDGVIAQAVDSVVGNGVAYFSSAGNLASRSYESAWRETGTTTIGATPVGNLHDFDPGPGVDLFQSITFPTGSTTICLQWDNPAASAGGPGASANINAYVTNLAGTSIILSYTTANIGGDPVEIIGVNNGGAAATVSLAFARQAGPAPTFIKYVIFGGNPAVNEFMTNSSTIVGHHNAAGDCTVGAAFYDDTPEFGTTPPALEAFSSRGGTLIRFAPNGAPIGPPVNRNKPDIVAPDGGNTTFFGQDFEPDGFPNFFGTSAAAPHAAGAAALLIEAHGGVGNISPAEICQRLKDTAVPMTEGADRVGAGLIDVLAAVEDDDGVLPPVEGAVPSHPSSTIQPNGDGNGDNIADCLQRHVSSFPNAVNGQYITLVSLAGAQLSSITALPTPPIAAPVPAGTAFPVGIVEFRATGPAITPAGLNLFDMILEQAPAPPIDSYWKYDAQNTRWIPFSFPVAPLTTGGLITSNRTIRITLFDDFPGSGLLYDNTGDRSLLVQDILDPSGPGQSNPLAVSLASLEAAPLEDGSGIAVRWTTLAELNNAGFNVYRANGNALGAQLNATIIGALGLDGAGASYEFLDASPLAPGEQRAYWLEDVDLNGTRTLHGPVSLANASAINDWTMY